MGRAPRGSLARRVAAAFALVAFCLAAAGAVAAAEADTDPGGRGLVVLLLPRGQEAYVEAGLDAFRAQVADLPVALRAEPVGHLPDRLADQLAVARDVATRTGARAVVWLDLGTPGETLVMLTGEGSRAVVRRVVGHTTTEGGVPPLEAAAVVLRSQLRALLGTAPAPPTAPVAPSRPLATVAVGYGVDAVAGGVLLGHAVDLRATVRPLPWLAIAVGARVGPGARVASDVADLTLDRWPLSLEVGWTGDLAPRWRLEATAGAALEVVRARHDALPRGWTADFDASRVLGGAALTVSVGYRLLPRLHLLVSLGADALFPHAPLAFERTGEREVLADPWPVRPRGALSLSFDLP